MIILDEYFQKVKLWYEANRKDLYTASIIFLVGMTGFGLGRLSILWPAKEPLKIITNNQDTITNNQVEITKKAVSGVSSKGKYVASKSGTSYHYPWCQGALKIKEENKIWFQTREEAEKAGYKPAGNCEGL